MDRVPDRPLVLLPGLDGTGALFAPFQRVWRGRPPTVIGYPTDRFLDYAAAADHVAAQLPPGRLVLLAESFSGPVGIELAARLPDRFEGLVLCATFACPPRREPLCSMIRLSAPLAFGLPAPAGLVQALLLNGHGDHALLADVCANTQTVDSGVMARRLVAVLRCEARAALRRIRCPLLYLQATRDRLVRRRGRRRKWPACGPICGSCASKVPISCCRRCPQPVRKRSPGSWRRFERPVCTPTDCVCVLRAEAAIVHPLRRRDHGYKDQRTG